MTYIIFGLLLIYIVSYLLLASIIFYDKLNRNHIGVINVFFIYYSLLSFPVLFYLILEYNFYIYFNVISDVFLLLIIGNFGLLLGIILRYILIKKISLSNQYFKDISTVRLLFFSLPFIFIAYYYFINFQPYLSLQYALEGDIQNAYFHRTSVTNMLSRNSFLYSLPFITIFPCIAILLTSKLIIYKNLKAKSFYLILIIIFILLSVFYSIFLLQKYYIAQLLILFFVLLVLTKKIKLSFIRVLFYSYIGILFISIIWLIYIGFSFENFINIQKSILERVFLVNVDGLIAYVDYYHKNNLLLGASFPNPLYILPYDPISLTKIISDKYIASSADIESNITGSHPTIFFAELLNNFGFIGSFIGSIFVGFFYSFFDLIFKGLRINPLKFGPIYLTIYSILITYSIELVTGSMFLFFSYLFFLNENILIVIILLLLSSNKYSDNFILNYKK